MECVELALKSSFRKKMSMNLSPQLRCDELGLLSAQNVVSCDDFSVDELLNFSSEDGFEEQENGEKEERGENEDDKGFASASVSPQGLENCENPKESSSFVFEEGFGSLPTTELSVPADDLADLEWLSHFVEDSFSDYSAPFPAGILTGKSIQSETVGEPEAFIPPQPCFETRVPAKARSKRARSGGRVWVLGSSSLTESSSSSTTSSSASSSPSSPVLFYNTSVPLVDETVFPFEKPPAKKPKKRPPVDGNNGSGTQTSRRCSHCGVQKTPQWRAGPLGTKTLCNACGVRYKSGRLLPEYRPACSPTFSSQLHSNHHRKVLEMRQKKDAPGTPEPGFPHPTVVPSF